MSPCVSLCCIDLYDLVSLLEMFLLLFVDRMYPFNDGLDVNVRNCTSEQRLYHSLVEQYTELNSMDYLHG